MTPQQERESVKQLKDVAVIHAAACYLALQGVLREADIIKCVEVYIKKHESLALMLKERKLDAAWLLGRMPTTEQAAKSLTGEL